MSIKEEKLEMLVTLMCEYQNIFRSPEQKKALKINIIAMLKDLGLDYHIKNIWPEED